MGAKLRIVVPEAAHGQKVPISDSVPFFRGTPDLISRGTVSVIQISGHPTGEHLGFMPLFSLRLRVFAVG
jgi:hypothetical protein